jgi:hypothetical protein
MSSWGDREALPQIRNKVVITKRVIKDTHTRERDV